MMISKLHRVTKGKIVRIFSGIPYGEMFVMIDGFWFCNFDEIKIIHLNIFGAELNLLNSGKTN